MIHHRLKALDRLRSFESGKLGERRAWFEVLDTGTATTLTDESSSLVDAASPGAERAASEERERTGRVARKR